MVLVKKNQLKQNKAAEVKTVEEPVQEEPVQEEPVQEEPVQEPFSSADRFKNIMTEFSELNSKFKELEKELKSFYVAHQKEVKVFLKNKKQKNKSLTPRKPHGFTKPVVVSLELASFLGQKEGYCISRPQVTKAISEYIKKNSLAHKDNGSIFDVDKKLKSILGEATLLVKPRNPELGVGYSYLNLHRYLSHHFSKSS